MNKTLALLAATLGVAFTAPTFAAEEAKKEEKAAIAAEKKAEKAEAKAEKKEEKAEAKAEKKEEKAEAKAEKKEAAKDAAKAAPAAGEPKKEEPKH